MLSDGTKVYYLRGDKDELLTKFNGQDLHMLNIKDRLILNLDGKSTCILHGEIFDTSPRLVKGIARTGPIGYNILCLNRRLTNGFSRIFRRPTAFRENSKRKTSNFSDSDLTGFDRNAVDLAVQNGYDTIICGYSHQPKKVLREDHKGKCLYLNSGDWVEHLTALEYSFKRWKLYSFKLDKLTAFYGDEELKELDIPELLNNLLNLIKNPGPHHSCSSNKAAFRMETGWSALRLVPS